MLLNSIPSRIRHIGL